MGERGGPLCGNPGCGHTLLVHNRHGGDCRSCRVAAFLGQGPPCPGFVDSGIRSPRAGPLPRDAPAWGRLTP